MVWNRYGTWREIETFDVYDRCDVFTKCDNDKFDDSYAYEALCNAYCLKLIQLLATEILLICGWDIVEIVLK